MWLMHCVFVDDFLVNAQIVMSLSTISFVEMQYLKPRIFLKNKYTIKRWKFEQALMIDDDDDDYFFVKFYVTFYVMAALLIFKK